MLIRRLIILSLLLALGLATVASCGVESVRRRERAATVERIAAAFNTDLTRARCEANPNWFLAGPREASPSPELLAHPDADVLAPRPDAKARPVEFFAYDIEYVGQSTAAPRLPPDMRAALRAGEPRVTAPFSTPEGTGVQTLVATGWTGPCAALLFRMHPPDGQFAERARMFAYLTLGVFIVLMLVAYPLDQRIRKVGALMRASAQTEYREPAAVPGRDELSSLGFAFNEATADIRRLQTDVADREADLTRFITHVSSEADQPLREALVNEDIDQAAAAGLHLSNLVTGARFRDIRNRVQEPVDVSAAASVAARDIDPAIRRRGVTLRTPRLDPGIELTGDPAFLVQAVRNLLTNALERVTAGGEITLEVRREADGPWALRVSDTGPGPSDIELRELNAVRRFRGDEGRGSNLRGDIGMNLAVVHEVCHRFAIGLQFRHPETGGLEVELGPAAGRQA